METVIVQRKVSPDLIAVYGHVRTPRNGFAFAVRGFPATDRSQAELYAQTLVERFSAERIIDEADDLIGEGQRA